MEALSSNIQIVEKERDFYFEKLRDIEVLMQHYQQKDPSNGFVETVQKILYATEDDKIIISEDGELIIESPGGEVAADEIAPEGGDLLVDEAEA